MKKVIIDNIKMVDLDHIIFLAIMGPEASEGYLHLRYLAKSKARKLIKEVKLVNKKKPV
jgi:hypothetical protein